MRRMMCAQGTLLALGLFLVLMAIAAFSVAPPLAFSADGEPAGISPKTGEPPGAPKGCCCFPKLHPTGTDAFDCKADMTEFDCKAECASFKDGRLPSGCKWAKGACAP